MAVRSNMQNKTWRQATTTSDPKGHAAVQCGSKIQDCLRTSEKSGFKMSVDKTSFIMSLPTMKTKLLLHSMNTPESVISHGSDHHQNASKPQMQESSQSAARQWQIQINSVIDLNPGTCQTSQGLGEPWMGQWSSWHASPTTHGSKLRPWRWNGITGIV